MALRIVIVGAGGQVGSALSELLASDEYAELYALTRQSIDVTKRRLIDRAFQRIHPHLVVNCAAMTDVDACEREPEQAELANAEAVRLLAAASEFHRAAFVQLSTDYVFDGESLTGYAEDAVPNPINHYGRSKLHGEMAARVASRSVVVRTSWVYSEKGNNFVTKILAAAKERPELAVVDDQRGNPTYARDLAPALVRLFTSPLFLERSFAATFHVMNSGTCTRYDQAVAVARAAGLNTSFRRIQTGEDGRPARRPRAAVLLSRRWEAAGLPPLRPWRDAVEDCVRRITGAPAPEQRANA